MKKIKNKEIIFGIISFILLLACLWFIGGFVQEKYGIYGLIITEIMILALAIIFAIVFKIPIKEMLPIKMPRLSEVFGVIIIWFASFIITATINLILVYFFPQMLEVTEALNEIITQESIWIAIIAVAVMPAICEEIFHRGLILTSFKAIKKDWVIILVMGIIFGIFHLDPYRFAGTGFLGAVLTYIMVKKRNIILPILFHFINNLLSTVVSFQNVNIDMSDANIDIAEASEMMLNARDTFYIMAIAMYLVFSFIAVFIFIGGNKLLLREKKNKSGVVKQA